MHGSISGVWKRGMAQLMRHRQTKGPETARPHLNYRATPRLYHPLLPGGPLSLDGMRRSTPIGASVKLA